MAATKIEWTGQTWNPVTGCTKVSAGCKHCYAERMAKRLAGRHGYPADNPFRVTLHPGRLGEPLRWRRPRMVFVCSMSDLFHGDVDAKFIAKVWAIMALTPCHVYQVLTKRPERMMELLNDEGFHFHVGWFASAACREFGIERPSELPDWPYANVWVGTSVEDQGAADQRIPYLLQTPAAVRFLSCEPLLGPVDLTSVGITKEETPWSTTWRKMDVLTGRRYSSDYKGPWVSAGPGCIGPKVDWVIAGSESGPGRRPCDPGWVRSLRDQCQEAGVPFFLKQLHIGGKKASLPELDGRQWIEFPNIGRAGRWAPQPKLLAANARTTWA